MNYIRTLLITAILTLAITAGLNWFVDPYGMYWSPLVKGINVNKPEAGNRSRTSKPYVLSKLKPATLIVGNSRVEMGLNPEHPLFTDTTYNIGIPGLGFSDQIGFAVNEIAANSDLNHIILSLDYLDFLHSEKELQTPVAELITKYENKLFNNNDIGIAEVGKMLFSLGTIKSSGLTIIKQSMNASSITKKGFNTATSFISIVKNEGKAPLFSQKLNDIGNRLRGKKLRHNNVNWDSLGPNFKLIKNLIRTAESKKVKVTFFINPYHMSYLHLLDDSGYWSDFLEWKTHLSIFFRTHLSSRNFAAYDFSGFNNITSEPVNLDNQNQRMQWFWEPAHYTSEVGDLMLPILLSQDNNPNIARDLVNSDLETLISSDKNGLKKTQKQWLELKERLNLTL